MLAGQGAPAPATCCRISAIAARSPVARQAVFNGSQRGDEGARIGANGQIRFVVYRQLFPARYRPGSFFRRGRACGRPPVGLGKLGSQDQDDVGLGEKPLSRFQRQGSAQRQRMGLRENALARRCRDHSRAKRFRQRDHRAASTPTAPPPSRIAGRFAAASHSRAVSTCLGSGPALAPWRQPSNRHRPWPPAHPAAPTDARAAAATRQRTRRPHAEKAGFPPGSSPAHCRRSAGRLRPLVGDFMQAPPALPQMPGLVDRRDHQHGHGIRPGLRPSPSRYW